MTQEALKLALEALERFEGNKKLWPEAITAIKEALAQTQEPKIGCVNHDCDKCKAQTQEPVAWVSEDVCKGQYIDGRPRKIWWECEKGVGTAFYITPPQRTWVGLTADEIWDEWLEQSKPERNTHNFVVAFTRAIEAKLKELNT
jgi:hypothetical protein